MINNKKINYVCLAILCPILIGLQINSTSWFRMKLADYYKNKSQYVKAIGLYNKILIKNSVKRSLDEETLSKVNFDLGYLYAGLDLMNLAIESYSKGSINFPDIDLQKYYDGRDLDNDKLLAIGLLEAGRWNKAIGEFKRLKQFYPQFQDMVKYINTAFVIKEQNFITDDKNFYFAIGDAYIQNHIFDEARAFFSKRILDYGIDPLNVLSYLQKRYSEDREVKQKVWGKDIYVTLEDFETVEPRLGRWLSEAKVNRHYITKEVAYQGNYSEFLDITNIKRRRDYWVKITNIPLNDTDLNLGIRLFIKSIKPSSYMLGINVIYSKHGISELFPSSVWQDVDGGWKEWRIENFFGHAKGVALRHKWGIEKMLIDKIILSAHGVSNKFYIDNIELYIVNQG